MTPATDCLKCPRCSMPCGVPLLGRHYTTFTGAVDDMRCLACGHRWREDDIDKCAQAWRAECAYVKGLRDEVQP